MKKLWKFVKRNSSELFGVTVVPMATLKLTSKNFSLGSGGGLSKSRKTSILVIGFELISGIALELEGTPENCPVCSYN